MKGDAAMLIHRIQFKTGAKGVDKSRRQKFIDKKSSTKSRRQKVVDKKSSTKSRRQKVVAWEIESKKIVFKNMCVDRKGDQMCL
jgi:hypothetical protein